MKDSDEDQPKPLARWTDMIEPASLSTRPGAQRFAVTIKLAEKSLKTATSLVKEANAALQSKIDRTPGCELSVELVLVDSERTRLQRATASFNTFKEAQTCFRFLEELGLRVNDISPELSDFGKKQYDPWHAKISQARWRWLALWRNPAPEMPMMKITNRLDVSEGTKYKEGKRGKLGKSDEENRNAERAEEEDRASKKRSKKKPRRDDDQGD